VLNQIEYFIVNFVRLNSAILYIFSNKYTSANYVMIHLCLCLSS